MADVDWDTTTATGERHPTTLLASYVLDVLDEPERRAIEAHLAACAACRRELAALQPAVDALATAPPAVAPPASARRRLFDRVGADREARRTVRAAVGERRSRGGAWVTWGGWAAGAAGLAAAAAMSWQLIRVEREAAALRDEVGSLQASLRELAGTLSEIDPATARIAALQGTAQAAGVRGRVVYQPGGNAALVTFEHLPPLEDGTVYQLWLLDGPTPASAGTFTPGPLGAASVVVRAPARLGAYTGVGLTAEPAPGRPSPTGAILAAGTLNPAAPVS